MQTLWQSTRSLGWGKFGLAVVMGFFLAGGWLMLLAGASQAAPLQQGAPSPSASVTVTPSPSLTITLTSTVSPTLTIPPASSPTPTVTDTPLPELIASPTGMEPAAPTEPFPTVAPAALEPGPSPTLAGPTATLLPLPSVTYQFPGVTPRSDLLFRPLPTAEALPKGQSPFALRLHLGRGWLLGGILLLWVGLIAWFAVAQIIARRP
jgi:hypothetical protein